MQNETNFNDRFAYAYLHDVTLNLERERALTTSSSSTGQIDSNEWLLVIKQFIRSSYHHKRLRSLFHINFDSYINQHGIHGWISRKLCPTEKVGRKSKVAIVWIRECARFVQCVSYFVYRPFLNWEFWIWMYKCTYNSKMKGEKKSPNKILSVRVSWPLRLIMAQLSSD